MVANDDHDQIISFPKQGGAHVQAGANLEAAGFELAQAEATVDVWPPKQGGQIPQPGEEVSAPAGRQGGDLGGGAARLEDSHRKKRG